VIASHYAEPSEREINDPTPLCSAPGEAGDELRKLRPGERFDLLDDTLGWAWGYAGEDRRVGYVKSAALAPN